MESKAEGNLIIIGGAEDKEKDKEILKFICSKLNKEEDLFLVATIATEFPKEVGENYKRIFKELGIKNIKILDVINREEGSSDENIQMVKDAAIVFFTGGDQLRITSILGGTLLGDEIVRRCENGCYFVGTSAGASVMSDTMIVKGPDDDSPRKCTLKMAPGLGMIKNVIIDQHFSQRGRIGRLLAGIAQNPRVLGVGIDEDTAIVVNKNGFVKVIGNGAVYILDGTSITYTNVSEQYQEKNLSMYNVKLHILTSGDNFDLLNKIPFKEAEDK